MWQWLTFSATSVTITIFRGSLLFVWMLYVFVLCAEEDGLMCELDESVGRNCVLRSPPINGTSNDTCLVVWYQLSSSDVELTVDVMMNGVPYTKHTLLASERMKYVSLLTVFDEFLITASRYLMSTEDREYALLLAVEFKPCETEKCKYKSCAWRILPEHQPAPNKNGVTTEHWELICGWLEDLPFLRNFILFFTTPSSSLSLTCIELQL